jgi:hypothetical protein
VIGGFAEAVVEVGFSFEVEVGFEVEVEVEEG